MTAPEEQILKKICDVLFKESRLLYFILDHDGKILKWHGSLSELGFLTPGNDSHISDVVLFMAGILPLKSQGLEFSCIKQGDNKSIDAFLFSLATGYGLIIWDAGRKEALFSKVQKEISDLSLMIEKQKNRISRLSGTSQSEHDRFLESLFTGLNLAVLEMNAQGHFVLIGTPPEWIEHIPQSDRILSGMAYEEDVFSFLGNFIREAKQRWAENKKGRLKSGVWVEKDQTNKDLLFEATALKIQKRKFLIISHDVLHP